MKTIKERVKKILRELPEGVQLEAAAKGRTVEELREAIEAGVYIIGENYVQESIPIIDSIGEKVQWHFIGHLQKNKVKYVVPRYDMIETVDSVPLAEKIDNIARRYNKIMPVLIEVNSGREPQKSGVLPEETEGLIKEISHFTAIKIMGMMTMGPRFGDPELARPFFRETKRLFDEIKRIGIPNTEMKILSMGMSNTYKIAIEEGSNLVRIGTLIFGERPQKKN